MANQDLSHLVFLLDRSGSMQSIKSDVIGGFDAFLTEQRAADGRCAVTLAQFDDVYEVVYQGISLGQVPPLEHEWQRPDIKALVEQQTNDRGWEFLYMGADHDAVEVGGSLGVKAEQSVTYGRGKSREAWAAASGNVRRYRGEKLLNPVAAMPAFTDEQRTELADD